MIAGLWNVPQSQGELDYLSFINADLHRRIALALQAQGHKIDIIELDPISPIAHEDWALRHQAVHNAQNGFLGIAGNDLTEFNPKDRERFEGWIQLHAVEMIAAAQKLGIA